MEEGEMFLPRIELCPLLGTTNTTITKAFSELQDEGYVNSIKGKGTFKIKKLEKPLVEKIENWGIITLDISTKQYSLVMKGISDVALKYGINLNFCNSNFDEKRQSEFITRMVKSKVDGLIIVPIVNQDWAANKLMYEALNYAKVPYVFCHRGCRGVEAPIVKKNDFFGAYLQTNYLIDSGCKKIIHVSNVKYQTSIERIEGYISSISESNLDFERRDVVLYPVSDDELTKKIEERLREDDNIDGICCFCDNLAKCVYKAVSNVGKKVGKDIKVIGYDDTELCEKLEPKLTSVKFDSYNMGKVSAQLLYKLTHGYRLPDFNFFLEKPEIVIRKSCNE